MYHATHAVRLFRQGTGQILAQFHLPTRTVSSIRRMSGRLQQLLGSPEAKSLGCACTEQEQEQVISIVLNPNQNPEEMPTRLAEFKHALRTIVGSARIETDYAGLR